MGHFTLETEKPAFRLHLKSILHARDGFLNSTLYKYLPKCTYLFASTFLTLVQVWPSEVKMGRGHKHPHLTWL